MNTSARSHSNPRFGVTLTEVLMSMLIMSIGVVGVAALFPVAILRSIQASQLTSAALARYNAEAAVDVFQSPAAGLEMTLVHDPDGDGNTVEHYRLPANRRYVVDPLGYFIHLEDVIDTNLGGDAATSQAKTSGKAWHAFLGVQFAAGSQGDIAGVVTSSLLPRFEGGYEYAFSPNATTNQNAPGIAPGDVKTYQDLVTAICGTRDAWETHVDTEVEPSAFATDGNSNAIGVTLPTDIDITTIAGTNARVILFDEEGQRSHSMPVVAIDNGILYWSETWDGNDTDGNGGIDDRALKETALSSELPLDEPLRLIIQVDEPRRYSWFLTVRKGSAGQASVDVVVVFNRKYDPIDEELYRARFDPVTNQIFVQKKHTAVDGYDRDPFIKKGGFVLDAQNARWYRIQGVDEKPLIGAWTGNTYDYILRPETSISQISGEDLDHNGVLDAGEDSNGNGVQDPTAIFMPGVVEVFPLGTIPLPESLQ